MFARPNNKVETAALRLPHSVYTAGMQLYVYTAYTKLGCGLYTDAECGL